MASLPTSEKNRDDNKNNKKETHDSPSKCVRFKHTYSKRKSEEERPTTSKSSESCNALSAYRRQKRKNSDSASNQRQCKEHSASSPSECNVTASCISASMDFVTKDVSSEKEETVRVTLPMVESAPPNNSVSEDSVNASLPNGCDEIKMKWHLQKDSDLKSMADGDPPLIQYENQGHDSSEVMDTEHVCLEEPKTPSTSCLSEASMVRARGQGAAECKGFVRPEAPMTLRKKKLIVLDINGLLADVIYVSQYTQRAHKRVGGKSVFMRPFCNEFLQFCFETFDVAIWTSRRRHNVEEIVDYLLGERKRDLVFCWDQLKCTDTGFYTKDNAQKPLVLKELRKIWKKEEDLPWEDGKYSPSNTLLIDDSPYKALCNPPNTAIFPQPYSYRNEDDTSLGPGGDLHVYLEGLAMANDVQQYVEKNPFGQAALSEGSSSWDFYHSVIEKIKLQSTSNC